jgi:hypothetical protein
MNYLIKYLLVFTLLVIGLFSFLVPYILRLNILIFYMPFILWGLIIFLVTLGLSLYLLSQ